MTNLDTLLLPAKHHLVAEQTTTSRFWRSVSSQPREFGLTVRLEIPSDEEVDVDIRIDLPPSLSEERTDSISRHLYAGVHQGFGRHGAPLPTGGIVVRISNLTFEPPLAHNGRDTDVRRLGETLESMVAGVVEGLWQGLSELTQPPIR